MRFRLPFVGDAVHDVRFALRTFLRHPAFSVVAVLTLALGIGATTAIFSVVDAVLLRPLPFPGSERLVWATGRFPMGNQAGVSPPDFKDYRAAEQTFDQLAAKAGLDGTSNIAGGGRPELVHSLIVSWNFFDALGIRPVIGRGFEPADEEVEQPQVAILGSGIWKRDFAANPEVVGRTVVIDGRALVIVGVLPADLPTLSKAEIWEPLPMRNKGMFQRGAHFLFVLGRLKPGVTIESAQADIDGIAAGLATTYPNTNHGWSLFIVPLTDAVLGPVRPALLVVAGAVGVLLLIACANVANLLLARGATRRRELAVRTALGAGRGRLVRQLLTESLVLAGIGGAVGSMIASAGVAWLRAVGPADVPRLGDIHVNSSVLVFALVVSVVTGVLFGIVPSFSVSKGDLKGADRSVGGAIRHRTSYALVVGEIAMSLTLLLVAGLLINSFWRLTHVDPGFRADGVVTARLSLPNATYPKSSQKAAFLDLLEERLRQEPGVVAAGAISELPLNGQYGDNPFVIEGRTYAPNQMDDADSREVSIGYISAMRIPLAAGRWFDTRDTGRSQGVVIVNDAFVKQYFPEGRALGQRLELAGDPIQTREVVGVIRTVSHNMLGESPRPEMYVPFSQATYGEMTIVALTSGDADALGVAFPRVVRSIDPDEAIADVRTMRAVVAGSVAASRFSTALVGLFAGVAFLIAAMGLHGVIAYTVAQRTREIGIRMALGASPRAMWRAVVQQGLVLVSVGGALGVAGALVLSRFVSHLLFGITGTDAATFVGMSSLLLVVAFVAPWAPARRAMRVDPVIALRQE